MKSNLLQFLWCVVVLFLVFAGRGMADEEHSLSIATFNVEFLTHKKLHLRYDLPFFVDPGHDSREDLVNALIRFGDDNDRRNFLRRFDSDEAYKEEIFAWADNDFRERKLDESIALVADYLATFDTDVLVLTEIGTRHEVLERLAIALEERDAAYPHRFLCDCRDSLTEQGIAVLSRIPLLETIPSLHGSERYYFELDDEVAEKRTRLSKALRVKFESGNQIFYLFAAHLKSELGGHESDAQRIAQASILRRHTVELIDQCESEEGAVVPRMPDGACPTTARPIHVVVTGDLNDHRGQPTLRRVRGFDDMYPDLIQTGHKEYFPESAWGTRWTKEHEGGLNHIDHVLLSDSIEGINRSSSV